jgi:dTMP kinase
MGADTPVEPAGITPVLAEKGGYKRLLSDRGFRNLWVAQTISGIGDWLVVSLLISIVTQRSNASALAIAGIMIAKIIPSLLFSSVIGAVVDRFDRRRLMIACDVVNAVLCLGLLGTNLLPDSAALAIIYTVTFLMEIANLLFVPAKNALIPMIVEERDLAAANGLSYTTQQASMLIGLLASGAIVAVFATFLKAIASAGIPVVSTFVANAPYLAGPQAGIVLDFFSFLFSALLIARIVVPANAKRAAVLDWRMFGHEVVESFTILREHKELRGFLTTIGFAILGGGAIIPVGLVYVQENLVGGVPFLEMIKGFERTAAQPPQTFILVFLALGMVSGAVFVPRLAVNVKLETLFVAGVAGFGLMMLGFSSVGHYWVASLFAIAAGFSLAVVTVAGNTYVAETVIDEQRGRVFTALESILRVALLLSMVVIAPIGDIVGVIVRRFLEATHGNPIDLVLTPSRITLLFASVIVLGAAVYAMRAIPWRRAKITGSVEDA